MEHSFDHCVFYAEKHEFTKIAREPLETEICQNQIIYVHVYGLILLARLVNFRFCAIYFQSKQLENTVENISYQKISDYISECKVLLYSFVQIIDENTVFFT